TPADRVRDPPRGRSADGAAERWDREQEAKAERREAEGVLEMQDQEGGEDHAGKEVRPGGARRDPPQPWIAEDHVEAIPDVREDRPAFHGWRHGFPFPDGDQRKGREEKRGGVEHHGDGRAEPYIDRARD